MPSYQCPHCSRPIDGTSAFCPHCGGRLTLGQASSPALAPVAATVQARSGPKASTIVIGVVLLIVLAIGAALVYSRLQVNSIVASLQPTPTPTLAAVPTDAPVVGSGLIRFGTGYDTNTLAITGARSTFARTYRPIAWSAEFSEPAGATTLTWILAKVTGGSVETTITTQDVTISNPQDDLVANKGDLAFIVGNGKGTYVMRYLRGATVLAEGRFTLQ